MTDPMTRPSEAEVKPIAELATFLAKRLNAYDMATAPKDYDPEKQHPSIFRAAADALESQAERIAELEASLAAIGSDTVEGKRIEEYVAHAVGRDTAKCALAAVKAALEGTQQ